MPHYFLVHDPELFGLAIVSSLKESWAAKSLRPIQAIATKHHELIQKFITLYHLKHDDLMLLRLQSRMDFDRDLWELLAGELMFAVAEEIPLIQEAGDTLLELERGCREMQEVHQGARPLQFGNREYRPFAAGMNSLEDVARLARYLTSTTPDNWETTGLSIGQNSTEEDLVEELAFAAQSLEQLRQLYERSARAGRLIVCETL